MKKFTLLVLFTLLTLGLSASELTADTPATEMTLLEHFVQWLWGALALALGWLIKNALPLFNIWLKEKMHFRGSAVVADALVEVIAGIGDELQTALLDGKITQEERQKIVDRVVAVATPRLEQLSGFYKSDLKDWIVTQVNILIAKLGMKGKFEKVTPNP